MENDTAGCPVSGQLWTRRTTASVAEQVHRLYGIDICDRTVSRLLREHGYALRVNHKSIASCNPAQRDGQFAMIAVLRARGERNNIPVISVDTKKKELVGRFRNPGAKWGRTPEKVNDHDFRSHADGIAVPYGIYDPHANAGSFYVGCSHDTPQFAVECIASWWHSEGRLRYPDATEIVILADAGGSNGCRPRAWKYFLQHALANRFNLQVTVAHYPAGASKYNPIEHRLFSEVSKHWAGVPLQSFEIILRYLKTTTTRTGLSVSATLVEDEYEKGIKISQPQMKSLNLEYSNTIPQWNYSIKPQMLNDTMSADTG